MRIQPGEDAVFGPAANNSHEIGAHPNEIGERIGERNKHIFDILRQANELLTSGVDDAQVVRYLHNNNVGHETLSSIMDDAVLTHKVHALTQREKLLELLGATTLSEVDYDEDGDGIEAAA